MITFVSNQRVLTQHFIPFGIRPKGFANLSAVWYDYCWSKMLHVQDIYRFAAGRSWPLSVAVTHFPFLKHFELRRRATHFTNARHMQLLPISNGWTSQTVCVENYKFFSSLSLWRLFPVFSRSSSATDYSCQVLSHVITLTSGLTFTNQKLFVND